MEGWRQRRPGSNEKNPLGKKRKTGLTLTGLLMEGLGKDRRRMLGSSFIGPSVAGRETRLPCSRCSFLDVAMTLGGIVRKGAEVVLSVMLFGFFVWRGIRNQSIGVGFVYYVLGSVSMLCFCGSLV